MSAGVPHTSYSDVTYWPAAGAAAAAHTGHIASGSSSLDL